MSSIYDADVSQFFDDIDHHQLNRFLDKRVKDGVVRRLINKWLRAGVLDGEVLYYPSNGSPQGGVISPLLSNVYLHYVLDEWFVDTVQPRLHGRAFLVRFADEFVIGCELVSDVDRLGLVIPTCDIACMLNEAMPPQPTRLSSSRWAKRYTARYGFFKNQMLGLT